MESEFDIKRNGGSFPIKRNFDDELFAWGKKLGERGLLSSVQDGPGGSLSYRYALGFVITARDADLAKLTRKDLIFVEQWDAAARQLLLRGEGKPPVESFLHAAVYQNRSGAIFAFFATAPKILKMASQSGLPCLAAAPFEDPASLMGSVEEGLGAGNIMVVPNRGALSFGCTAEDAGEQILSCHSAGV